LPSTLALVPRGIRHPGAAGVEAVGGDAVLVAVGVVAVAVVAVIVLVEPPVHLANATVIGAATSSSRMLCMA
jgi:hypothetical protein